MTTFLNLFRRPSTERDAMRESTALTTVYLLELNQKFEGYMRRKVEELEGRVAAQQARQRAVNLTDDATRPVAVVETEAPFDFEPPESLVEPLGVTADRPAERLDPVVESEAAELPAEPADYLSLLGGTSSIDPAETEPDSWIESPELPGELVERDLDLTESDGDEWDTALTDDDEAEDWA